MTETQQRIAAHQFTNDRKDKGHEKGDTTRFLIDLLQNIYGVNNPTQFIFFQEQVKVINTNFIDAHISAIKVLIEQKSIIKGLRAPSQRPRRDEGLRVFY